MHRRQGLWTEVFALIAFGADLAHLFTASSLEVKIKRFQLLINQWCGQRKAFA
jgi:hypothetical protein